MGKEEDFQRKRTLTLTLKELYGIGFQRDLLVSPLLTNSLTSDLPPLFLTVLSNITKSFERLVDKKFNSVITQC